MECFLALSERGGPVLFRDGFKFTKKLKRKNGNVKWICDRKSQGCTAKIFTQGESTDIIRHSSVHNHEPDVKKYTRQVISNTCKRKATEDLLERPQQVIRQVLTASTSASSTVTDSDVSYIRQRIWSARKQHLSQPRTEDDVPEVLECSVDNTRVGDHFMLGSGKD